LPKLSTEYAYIFPGLRWIFEALTGGDLSGIPTKWFTNEYSGKAELSQIAIDKEFEQVRNKLKSKHDHVIVGHNLFTDLVYLYKTFVGPLPLDVEVFQNRIHKLFPVVFDTKYLATKGHDAMSTVMRQGLDQLLEPFKKIHTPLVVLHEEHTKYGASIGKNHEAGFDSWCSPISNLTHH
jgi:poly(A)-specific ribonuclease